MGILKHIPEYIIDRIPKVYFSCHKDDFKQYFKEISEDILKGRRCAIFYDEDYEGVRDEHFYFDLSQMNLFVMPITTRLLTKPNRAIGEELAFALEHKIPVLPLMQESGLEELFRQKFGDLQFLDKNSHDLTALSYEEKLDKYLSSALLNDKTIKRIRAEFDAQIFLSYRKKDRIHANRLMRLIHKNDFCRDIAIWYDEFLTPGEDFNETIKTALNNSDLFVLAVTPNLVNEKNYVMTVEYPEAKKAGKIILPAELVKTDRALLSQKYENIPDCVDSEDENALTEALLNTAKKLVNDENDNSLKHNYLIGLAYLDGIDVEVDHARALEMIQFAANADYIEAIDKLIEMYSNGRGVKRNYETAIQWHEKKIALLQKKYDEKPNEDRAEWLFNVLADCGDNYYALARYGEAKEKYERALGIYEWLRKHYEQTPGSVLWLRMPIYIYRKLGDVYTAEGDVVKARGYYEKSREISEAFSAETNMCEARRSEAISNTMSGDTYLAQGDTANARPCYERALPIFLQIAREANTDEARYDLSVLYERFGELYFSENNIEKAREYYEKSLELRKSVGTEANTAGYRRGLSVSYNRLGDIYKAEGDTEKAREYYEKALEIREQLADETGTPEALYDLALSYYRLSSVCEDKKPEYLQKALNIMNALCDACPSVETYEFYRWIIQNELTSLSEDEE